MHRKNGAKSALLAGLLAVCLAVSASAAPLGVGVVKDNGLRLRTAPGLDSAVITTADKDQRVMVLEQAGDWFKVDYGTQVGYMSAAYLDLATELTADLGYGVVTTGGGTLNLRSGPGTGHPILASLNNYCVVSLTGFQDGWYQVTYNGLTGYVSGDYITLAMDASGSRADGAATLPTASAMGQAIADEAMKQLGKAYVHGNEGPNSFDCSGLVYYVYKQLTGVATPRTCDGLLTNGPGCRVDCSIEECQPGDLMFFCKPAYRGSKLSSHVAISLGNNRMIHASSPTTGVIITTLKPGDIYYRDLVGVRRVS